MSDELDYASHAHAWGIQEQDATDAAAEAQATMLEHYLPEQPALERVAPSSASELELDPARSLALAQVASELLEAVARVVPGELAGAAPPGAVHQVGSLCAELREHARILSFDRPPWRTPMTAREKRIDRVRRALMNIRFAGEILAEELER